MSFVHKCEECGSDIRLGDWHYDKYIKIYNKGCRGCLSYLLENKNCRCLQYNREHNAKCIEYSEKSKDINFYDESQDRYSDYYDPDKYKLIDENQHGSCIWKEFNCEDWKNYETLKNKDKINRELAKFYRDVVESGNIKCLDYFHEKGYYWTGHGGLWGLWPGENVIIKAIRSKNIEMFKFIEKQYATINESTHFTFLNYELCPLAASKSVNFEFFKYIVDYQLKIDALINANPTIQTYEGRDSIYFFSMSPNKDKSDRNNWIKKAMIAVLKYCDQDSLIYLINSVGSSNINKDIYESAFYGASSYIKYDCFKYLFENSLIGYYDHYWHIYDVFHERGNFDCMAYAYDKKFPGYEKHHNTISNYKTLTSYLDLFITNKNKSLYFGYIPKDINDIIKKYLDKTIKKYKSKIEYVQKEEYMGCTLFN